MTHTWVELLMRVVNINTLTGRITQHCGSNFEVGYNNVMKYLLPQ